jgi:hypothetical protein
MTAWPTWPPPSGNEGVRTMMKRAPLLCVTIALLATSCRGRDVGVSERQAALNFETGNVSGTIRWNGSPVAPQHLLGGLFASESNGVGFWVWDSSYSAVNLAAGSHTLALYGGAYCFAPRNRLGETSFTVSAGQTTTADFDLTTSAGEVRASITASGAPLAGAWIVLDSACPIGSMPTYRHASVLFGFTTDGVGALSRLLVPGAYTAQVYGPSGRVGSFAFSVAAGETTNLGTIDFSTGSLQWSVSWQGAPANPQDIFSAAARDSAGTAFWLFDSNGTAASVPVGTHTVRLFANSCSDETNKLGESTLTIEPGATSAGAFDLTSSAGRVVGALKLNGSPFPDARLAFDTACMTDPFGFNSPLGFFTSIYSDPADLISPTFAAAPDGTFSRLLAPGSYTANVFGASGRAHSFTFTIAAGETTNLGDVDVQSGEAHGTILWNGAAIGTRESSGPPLFITEAGGVGFYVEGSLYSAANLAPGDHSLALQSSTCDASKIGETTFTLSPGSTVTSNFDLTATAGKLVGSINVNGQPLQTYVTLSSNCTYMFTDQGGAFARLLAPGDYEANVWGQSGLFARFNFKIFAGKTTNVDGVTTPVGHEVRTELAGGPGMVGGISLVFPDVTSAGETFVAENGGPPGTPPPTAFKLVGERFWDIDSSALFAGMVEVCFHYDQAWVGEECSAANPFADECQMRLFHDNGSGFVDITTSNFTDSNLICGETSSLSPFALFKPVRPPNTRPRVVVPPDIVGEAVDATGAPVTFTANASDAEDGAITPTCTPASGSKFPLGTTTVTCKATDSGDLSAEAPFKVTVRDTTAPSFSNVPGTTIAFATSTRGAKVTYDGPKASDAVDGARPVSCTPVSGSTFKPGKTPVTCTASDTRDHVATASFTVWVQYQAPADGSFFLKPIRAAGTSIFCIGRPVPVKFTLTGASKSISDVHATLVVSKISDKILGTTVDESDEDTNDTDFVFKYRRGPNVYAYRWKTKGQAPGTYQLRADLGDEVVHQVNVSLKAAR